MAPSVAVIILNYQGRRWLEACCASVLATEYASFRVFLVDNASTDGSVEFVRERFPQIEVIFNQTNCGFSEGNNIGIRVALDAGADYVVLLNPDTRVPPRWLAELIEVGESEPSAGILGAVQLEYDSEEFNTWTKTALPQYLDELRAPASARRWIPVEWVEGACFAVKRQVIDQVGLLDPIYFAFYEEIDFCRRATCRGWQVALVTRCRIHHMRGGSWAADEVIKRERDYRCDRSQFIYTLTEPRRTLTANLAWYFITLGTKVKEVAGSFSPERAWDLARLQFDVLGSCGSLIAKWRRDRSLTS